MTLQINITPGQLQLLGELLNKYLPRTQVWAFGSRVKGTSRTNSDLDLVVFSTQDQMSAVNVLKEAFDESSLPFSVDVLIWDQISESFRQNILERYAVLTS
jgi:type I restriction enzyme S subunit